MNTKEDEHSYLSVLFILMAGCGSNRLREVLRIYSWTIVSNVSFVVSVQSKLTLSLGRPGCRSFGIPTRLL